MKCEECGYVSWDLRTEPLCPADTKVKKVKDYKCPTCGYFDVNVYFMVKTARDWMNAKEKRLDKEKIKIGDSTK